jgi:PKD repeat protein
MNRSLKYFLAALVLALVMGSGFFNILGEVFASNPTVGQELTLPTEIEGYATGIQVGGGSLTGLVVTVTNYVLGFLGLLCITAIIYAGFLYVGNFGDETMTGKAKTIIIYVAIGVVVILMSYAIVNTLLRVANQGGSGGGLSSGRVSPGDEVAESLESLFDIDGKDYILPLLTALRQLGDLCPSTPIGLASSGSGCAVNELVPDTDGDGIANLLDTDIDNDGTPNDQDSDRDGDEVSNAPDSAGVVPDDCPDTLSFVVFKTSNIESRKLQIDRVAEPEYQGYIQKNAGCAEYQRLSDIDGDTVIDSEDCDRDADGLLDNEQCVADFNVAFPVGNPETAFLTPETTWRGVLVFQTIRDSVDTDSDQDSIPNFGEGLQPDARDLLLRELANNFDALKNFIRISCATLPQTLKVLDFCGYDPQGQPFGRLVRMLDKLSSDLTFVDFDAFNALYQDFIALARSFKRVKAVITVPNNQFEGFLPPDNSPLKISFDATKTVDPYTFCSPDPKNYYWFVNKNLDFKDGLAGVINSATNAPTAIGYFFNYEFPAPGLYNVQLLVKSACKYNNANPGANEAADVDAAIAGLTSARISVFPARARLIVKVAGQPDRGGQPVQVLAGAQIPIAFDATESITSRGNFTSLIYDCGNGTGQRTILGNQSVWNFTCEYTDASGSKAVILKARDAEGDVDRTVPLQFSDVIAFLNVLPDVRGSTETTFTFDGSKSSASQQIRNYTFVIAQKKDVGFEELKRFQEPTITFKFPTPGEYRVTLEVSTGGGPNQLSTDTANIIIEEQAPIAAFKITFPETIKPARALFDGSLSFHPDFPNGTTLTYTWEVDGAVIRPRSATVTGPYAYEQQTLGSDQKIFYEFQTVGEHQVALTVAKGDKTSKTVDKTTVKNLLGVDFTIDKPGARVNEIITFTPQSDKALGFFWNFGDGVTLVGSAQPVVHKYEKQGIYKASLTVEDGAGNTNVREKKVRVGLADKPVTFTQLFVNNIEQDLTQSDCVEVSRKDSVVFDAGKSVNTKGEKSGLSYLWEIEDFDEVVRNRTFSRSYKELTKGGCIDVKLTVTDLSTNASSEPETISIEVVNLKPELTDVKYATANQLQLVTPVTVDAFAVGARDVDGQVMRYRWWYYEEGQGGKKLDQRLTDSPRTTFVIGPNNVEGTKTTYFFAVELEDSDGATMDSLDAVGPSEPLVLTNGPNNAPLAEFVTNRATVAAGDTIQFTSTSKDPLGEFIPSAAYQWDFDGDGEFERGVSGAKVSYRYDKPGTYKAALKVTKNGLSSRYEMLMTVRASTKKPEAAYIFIASGAEVKFISNSTVDPALGVKDLVYAWDFDTTIDTDGNGLPDDDTDSALPTPIYTFKGDRDVLVGLRVTDSVGSSDQVVRKIPFVLKEEYGALGVTKVVKLKAVLTTNPPLNAIDGRLYLTPPASDVIFNAKQSTGKIQEYRLDTNIFVDSDGDGILDNDIDNKTDKSWKEGSSFKRSYRESDGKIRAKLTVVDIGGQQKAQVVDIIFSNDPPKGDLQKIDNPDELALLFANTPQILFEVSSPFAQPAVELTFDASATKFPDEKVKEFRWDFDGDGLVDEVSFEPTIKHAYDKVGVYDASLEAVSERGLQGEYTQSIFVRGGVNLPVADFSYDLKDNEVAMTNTSTFDTSFTEEQIQYQWTFTQLDVGSVLEWDSWEQLDDLILEQRDFTLSPARVKSLLQLKTADTGNGVISRELVLGAEEFIVRFKQGTTFLGANSQPYSGDLKFFVEPDDQVSVPNTTKVYVIQTSVVDALSLSDEALFIYNGLIDNAQLYQILPGAEPALLDQGTQENNLTTFTLKTFGGRYLLTGTVQPADSQGGQLLGVSTVKDPVKVFTQAGVYQVLLQVTDPNGETSEKKELLTVDNDLKLVEPGTKVPGSEELPPIVTETPVTIPAPVVTTETGGLSYWWIAIIIALIGVAGAVVWIVVKTIRQRQEELGLQGTPGVPPSVNIPTVIEPEVITKPSEPTKEEKAPPPAEPAKAKDDKSSEAEAKDDEDDKKPKGPTGPIPDWLKG